MKKKFSGKWKASKQPRKQRKYRANAPLHVKKKFLSANLSRELRKKYNKRNVPLRNGDKVKIMRGTFRKKTGTVNSVNLKKLRISIGGIQRQKKDGTKINIYFKPSNLQIIELKLDDKKREASLKRGGIGGGTKTEKENKNKEPEKKQKMNKEKKGNASKKE